MFKIYKFFILGDHDNFLLSFLQYYGVLFGLLLVVVFAYQYLPLMKIFYLFGMFYL